MILIQTISRVNFTLTLWAKEWWAEAHGTNASRLPNIDNIIDIVYETLQHFHQDMFRVEARYIDTLEWEIRFYWFFDAGDTIHEVMLEKIIRCEEFCGYSPHVAIANSIRRLIQRFHDIELSRLLPQETNESRRGVYGSEVQRRIVDREFLRQQQLQSSEFVDEIRSTIRPEIPNHLLEQFEALSPSEFASLILRTAVELGNNPVPSQAKSLGDTTCSNNARSPFLLCAVNPCGPCDGCSEYVKSGND